ncbi:LacI family DNA-binding transcriptional regulator [Microcella humidisoli]|uniref:LacI family DNA-binding transcriptional regulator n=1 Tax=Microcella humidisoli TaxID=2963406 RepID=A0ABY5G0C1_9MICO|nr:LacI family DNA-binding transcriptional regulator [Microcella humidisoli]UTT63768.1 LacI family DNA-binding transcriptional regulator [Microcella humidisoli]
MDAAPIHTPTIRDVARAAGVSHQTVSRVLNEHPNVSRATRERVSTAIAKLGYQPSRAAVSLATNQSRMLGILTASTTQYGPISGIAGIEQAARSAGYWVCTVDVDPHDRKSIVDGLDHLYHLGIDGLVVIAPQRPVLDVLNRHPLRGPVVTLGSTTTLGAMSLTVDQTGGARAATRHLLENGHTRIAHIGGPADWEEAAVRAAAFNEELLASGIAPGPTVLGDWTSASGYRAARRLLDFRPTGVFAANDQMALGAIHAFNEAGLRVPDDVSIVGFDDLPDASHFAPPLTTVRQDFTELGRAAVDLLLGIKKEMLVERQPQLVLRDSVRDVRDLAT